MTYFCSQCGKKLKDPAEYCSGCKKKISRQKPALKNKGGASGFKVKDFVVLHKIKLIFGFLFLIVLGMGIAGAVFLTKKTDEIEEEKGEVAIEVEEGVVKESNVYPALNGIEKKMFAEAKPGALSWDKKAQVCYFSTTLDYLKDDRPYTKLTFCAPENEEVFNWHWHNEKSINTEIKKKGREEPLTQFPHKISAVEAADLAIAHFGGKKGETERVSGLSFSLYSGNDFWSLTLKARDDADAEKEVKEVQCQVYVDRQVYCQEETVFVYESVTELAQLFENAETVYLKEASEEAKKWDSKAKLSHFHAALYRSDEGRISLYYSFFSEDKEEIFTVHWQPDSRPETKTREVDYIPKKEIPGFPSPLLAAEALDLALADFETQRLEGEEMFRLRLILQRDHDFWQVGLEAKDALERSRDLDWRIYFDKLVERK